MMDYNYHLTNNITSMSSDNQLDFAQKFAVFWNSDYYNLYELIVYLMSKLNNLKFVSLKNSIFGF